jgi:hypothetical protein
MRIERALLIGVLTVGLSASAQAKAVPSASPSPATGSKAADLLLQKPTPDDEVEEELGGMKLLAPGIGWAERSIHHYPSGNVDEIIYWTTDNGRHWRNITPPAAGKGVSDFFFLDTHRGWTIFWQSNEAEQRMEPRDKLRLALATTTDAGATWSKTPLTLVLADYFSKDDVSEIEELWVSGIAFADPRHGWLQLQYWIEMHLHASLLLVTSDGGKTWKEADSYPRPNFPDMVLLTPKDGWVFGTIEPDGPPNSLFVTRDGTRNWQEIAAQSIENLGDFVKKWHEMLLQPHGELEEEGADCEVYDLPMFKDPAHGLLEEDCSVDVVGGDPVSMHTTVLFATNDGGRTWKQDRTVKNFVGLCNSSTMVDSTWIAPVKQSGHLALLHVGAGATVDAGEDNGSRSRYSLCETRVSFVSLAQGWMLADHSVLQSTTDGGQTWTTITPGHYRK